MESNLGLRFVHTEDGIYIDQTVMIEKKQEQYNLTELSDVRSLPAQAGKKNYIEAQIQRATEKGDDLTCDNFFFLSMVNSIRFIERHTRPDIAYAVGAVSRYMHKPNVIALEYLRIFGDTS